MLAENQKEFTKCNITKWHNWGYEGQGVKIAVLDEDCQSDDTMAGWAKFPLGEAKEGGHGIPVAKVLHEVAPQAEIHLFSYLSGYGLFVLPGQLEPTKITMEIGRKEATVNGEEK